MRQAGGRAGGELLLQPYDKRALVAVDPLHRCDWLSVRSDPAGSSWVHAFVFLEDDNAESGADTSARVYPSTVRETTVCRPSIDPRMKPAGGNRAIFTLDYG